MVVPTCKQIQQSHIQRINLRKEGFNNKSLKELLKQHQKKTTPSVHFLLQKKKKQRLGRTWIKKNCRMKVYFMIAEDTGPNVYLK